MPELPEVETVVRGLRAEIVGASFVTITTEHEPHVVWGGASFDDLEGAAVLAVERRGKFIVIFLERGFVMVVHLRMSGRVLVRDFNDEVLRFERTRIEFNSHSLRFCDMRKFGRVWVSTLDDYEQLTGISRLGVEPFSKDFSADAFAGLLEGRRGSLKKWLLDQSLVTGIGNIYADEACFYAGVRPDRDISSLEREEIDQLFCSIIKALEQGIANKGTSISDFQDAYGSTGRNQEILNVYGRGGAECVECKEVLEKIKLAGRTTVFCKKCQS